ncbi:TIGR03621 family F420-dependent LLM class oxidoreductase [Actinomadura nitritigenes]|uniref:TIGR03621 family F420-dependent LLM class oxidoreductase n=1 Tax=Actinomadura nitritigenes TaxID=134602 RepID=UPI003D91AD71
MHPFRFAVQATKATTGAQWRELARKAEDLGYATLFVADHYLGPGPAARESRLPPQHLAPIAAMATAAAVTETLRVGCRVFCVDYHVPAVLAKEAATLDLLSDGRLEFGIGAGWSEREYRSMGLDFAAPARRVDKLEDVVALLKAHWSGEPLNHQGPFATATGYAGLPLPARRPHPSIMIGGARRRVLSLAAREGDIVSINNVPFDAVNDAGRTPAEEAAHRFAAVREAAGERLPDLEIESSPFFTEITDDPAAAVARVAGIMGVPPDGLPAHPNVLVGSLDEVTDRLQQRRETYGANYITVQQREMERFAPAVARLAGR